MTSLAPCPRCRRHVRVEERTCPFCRVPFEHGELKPAPVADPRLGRAALLAWQITLGGSVAVACAASNSDGRRPAGVGAGGSGERGSAVDASAGMEAGSASLVVSDAGQDVSPQPRVIAIYSDTSIIARVRFKPHSARVSSEMNPMLEEVAKLLIARPELGRIEVQGHADVSEGGRAKWLSEQRARAVRDRLTKLGVPAAQLVVKGNGASAPMVPSTDPKAREINPRVTFSIMGDSAAAGGASDAGGSP